MIHKYNKNPRILSTLIIVKSFLALEKWTNRQARKYNISEVHFCIESTGIYSIDVLNNQTEFHANWLKKQRNYEQRAWLLTRNPCSVAYF